MSPPLQEMLALCRNIDTVLAVLHALAELLSYRCNTSMRRSILMEFFRCMAVHGVPFRYLLGSRASKYLAREEYNEKYPPSMNIKQFFCDLSKLEYGLRSNIWSFHTVQMGTSAPQMCSPLVQRSSSLQSLRYQLCMASRKLNYRAVVAQLGNSEVIRMTSETIEKRVQGWREINYQVQKMIYFDSPVASFMSLQSTLAMKHDASFHVGNRLAMLATMQAMIYTTTAAENTILMQLCEALISAMLCGNLSNLSTILALEHQIHRYNKGYDNAMVWNAYKLMAEYEEWRGRTGFVGMILNTAQSLFETADGTPTHGTLFLETACRIWAKNGRCEDKMFRAEAVSRIVQKCPQLLGRVTEFLKEIDYDHEVEVITEEVCSAEDSTLHPSDPAWLEWCQPRVERPERYGKRANVLARCVNVLFRFLDYGSNRGSGQAWVLLHAAVQLVDPSLLISMWTDRYDWWPHFHTVSLPPEAESLRAQLLAALAEFAVE
ncbi:hypothetical protein Aduo_014112 [Ancylostoma duodenale]